MFLFNTLNRKKELFRPLSKNQVSIYTCGPTVYDVAHIGNLRAYVVADILVRILKYLGNKLKWAVNITDIDDKTIQGALKAHKSLKSFTKAFEDKFYDDIAKLNVSKADRYPRATEHFLEMKELVKQLIVKQLAYETSDGIYFDISKFNDYGKLSGLAKQDLKPGARVDVDSYDKQSPGDFALWKFQNSDLGIQKSDSPTSDIRHLTSGRPGWHLECSAMSRKYLGQPFDIHTGGVDLIFPHHENEIAQSVGAYGKPLANYFLHNEHLLVEGKKMAKSEGNYITLDTIIEKNFDPLALRYLFLQTHYREKMNFTWSALEAAQQGLEHVRAFVQRESRIKNQESRATRQAVIRNSKFVIRVREALENDLNTPKALGLLHEVGDSSLWLEFDAVLGLGLSQAKNPELTKAQKELIDQREQLRKAGEFSKADKIRERLAKQRIVIEDTPDGPRVLTDR